MSDCAYKPGERVRTPAHTEGVVVTVHRGRARGRLWREPRYSIEIPGLRYAAAYYESELTRIEGT